MDHPAGHATQVDFFHNFGNLLRPLEFVPTSRERVVPTEWQVRSFLGDHISKLNLISIRAPQYRQYMLISDFLDLVDLGIREEAILATNWIKDRPQGMKLQNLALANITGPALRSYPKNMTANVQHALNKCESFGSGKPWILHKNPSAIAEDCSRIWNSFDAMFCQIWSSSAA